MAADILKQALWLVTPSEKEEARIQKIRKEVEQKANSQLKKSKINAKIIPGGSVAKGTWLPGLSDMDFFISFDAEEYQNKSAQLSDFAERVLREVFRVQRLHGSRDYFALNYKGFYLEFVPVLEIKNKQQARNITDFSPLHVNWVRNKIAGNKKLQGEIQLAKQFFKAAGVYGAESYISGFSGHAIEILVINYSSLNNLLRSTIKWNEGQAIDVEHRYKNSKCVFATLNKSKLQSPIILIDPVEPERNALAALNEENFLRLKAAAKNFLAKPSIEFFKEKRFSTADLIKEKGHRKLVVLEARPDKGKLDVVGCRLLDKFKKIKTELEKNDFEILDSGWHWNGKSAAHFWFYFPNKALEKTKMHLGPPARMKEAAAAFRKKWKRVFVKNGTLATELKRKYVLPEQLVKDLIKANRSLRFTNA